MVYLNMCSIPSTTISLARLNRLKLRLLTEFWIRTTRWPTTLTCRASLGSCSCECLSCKESARSSHPHIFTSSHLPSSRACSRPSPSASSRPSLCLSRPHLLPRPHPPPTILRWERRCSASPSSLARRRATRLASTSSWSC